MEIKNKRLQAAQSHFISQRDRAIAELDSMLNAYAATMDMDTIIRTFEKLALSNMALSNINSIIEDNSDQQGLGGDFSPSDLEEMNAMADAISSKLNLVKNNEKNQTQLENAEDNTNII
jgi:hypothetical protein